MKISDIPLVQPFFGGPGNGLTTVFTTKLIRKSNHIFNFLSFQSLLVLALSATAALSDTPPTYQSAIKIHRPQQNNVHSLQEKTQVRF